jgi:uncharacterized damage-inducible protein DinB
MSPETKTEIVQILENGRQEFLEAASGLTEADAQAHPQAGRWSVLECVEHVTVVEEIFLGRIENAAREGAPPVDKQHEADLASRIKDRSNRAQAPEIARPTGRYPNLSDALEAFKTVRARTIRFAEQNSADLYSRAGSHPRFGPLNGIEFLVMMNAHVLRHGSQIRELRTDLRK